ncbi:hypothetical protein [Pleionea sediminis]|uniref:hypothetical protein n=1 Tax=Pleionea sediminis TaxID=2569479 RepID=UPI0011859451|nr:hypothetical protein [Pleionea sediminis]
MNEYVGLFIIAVALLVSFVYLTFEVKKLVSKRSLYDERVESAKNHNERLAIGLLIELKNILEEERQVSIAEFDRSMELKMAKLNTLIRIENFEIESVIQEPIRLTDKTFSL